LYSSAIIFLWQVSIAYFGKELWISFFSYNISLWSSKGRTTHGDEFLRVWPLQSQMVSSKSHHSSATSFWQVSFTHFGKELLIAFFSYHLILASFYYIFRQGAVDFFLQL